MSNLKATTSRYTSYVDKDTEEAARNLTDLINDLAMLKNDLLAASISTDDIKEDDLKKYFEQREAYFKKEFENNIKRSKDARELDRQEAEAIYKKQFEKELADRRTLAEAAGDKKTLKKLDKITEERIKKEAALRYKYDKLNREKEAREKKKADAQKGVEARKEMMSDLLGKDSTIKDRIGALKQFNADGLKGVLVNTFAKGGLASTISDWAKKMDSDIESIASKKSLIDTRLQGSKQATKNGVSYWDQISSDIIGVAGVSPLVKQESIVSSVEKLVNQGISFNVEQRATIDALSDKIAGTFDVTNATLKRLVRVQQQDTTAARLGMESALTAFLNNMYETTEYMGGIADGIKSNLEEAMSLMSGENALSFEYQVQKWMGSMYSVGMNQSSVSNLAGVIGQIAAGQLEGLTNGTTGNLAIMAANRAGLSISDMMANGLTDAETNKLMQSMVEYLANIYDETKDNNVLQQQYASIYGLTASDLKAISNLSSSVGNISQSSLTYGGAMNRLNSMANSMYQRTSVGEMMSNALSNAKYSMAAGIASNPGSYMTYQLAKAIDMVGGLEFSLPLVMGTGTAQTFNVADIMRAGAMTSGLVKAIGQMVTSGGNGGITGGGILSALGIGDTSSTYVTRGTGVTASSIAGATTSQRGTMVANSSAGDITTSVQQQQMDENNATIAQAKAASDEKTLTDVNNTVSQIYELFNAIIVNGALKVSIASVGTSSSYQNTVSDYTVTIGG